MTDREKFTRPDKYPGHWLFWGAVTLVVLALLVTVPPVGAIALVLLVGVAIGRLL